MLCIEIMSLIHDIHADLSIMLSGYLLLYVVNGMGACTIVANTMLINNGTR